ncbi:MAG: hypothetical protein FWC65_03860 [Treponema sp.]|nr:hypothetical protein [Treponema sp.]
MAPLKDAAILAGWLAGLVLAAGITWFFTQPVREQVMLRAVNHALEQSGDPRRLGAPVSSGALETGVSRIGWWYTMTGLPEEGTRAFVFALIADGTFFPVAAVVPPAGAAQEFIPLTAHGQRALRRISPEILELYRRRIAGARS